MGPQWLYERKCCKFIPWYSEQTKIWPWLKASSSWVRCLPRTLIWNALLIYKKVGAFGCLYRSSNLVGTVVPVFLSSLGGECSYMFLGFFFSFLNIWLSILHMTKLMVSIILYLLSEFCLLTFDIFQWFRNRYVKHIWFDLNIAKANVTTNSKI